MQSNQNPIEFYQLLCATFPNASLFVVSREGHCVSDFKGDFHLFESATTFSGIKEATGVHIYEKLWLKIGLPYNGQYQLFVFFPEGVFPDSFTPARMIDTLYQLYSRKAQTSDIPIPNERSIQNLFIYQLFNCRTQSDATYTSLLATKLGLDLTSSRLVCLLAWENGESTITPQQLNLLLGRYSDAQDIHGEYGAKWLVYCPHFELSTYRLEDWKEHLVSLKQHLEKRYNISIFIGVGLIVHSLGEYGTAIYSARIAMEHANSENPVCFALDYPVEHMLQSIPEHTLHHFLGAKTQFLRENPLLLSTAEALVNSNMDILQAAEALSVHRNTVVFRIGQIRKILGINPLHRDNDRFLLILICVYARMNQAHQTEQVVIPEGQ